MMRAQVNMYGRIAGMLSRDEKGVYFQYSRDYLAMNLPPLSCSLPLQEEPFISDRLHPYFAGLVSEGWLRRVQSTEQRIDPEDKFALLVHNGADLPGAITIELLDMP